MTCRTYECTFRKWAWSARTRSAGPSHAHWRCLKATMGSTRQKLAVQSSMRAALQLHARYGVSACVFHV
eukprot:6212310-Pleurochrysis_carterae.AAC.3